LARIEERMRFIEEHERKIDNERKRPRPDEGLIKHWQGEIRGAHKAIDRYKPRLEALGWKI
jgi:hypothetical protein